MKKSLFSLVVVLFSTATIGAYEYENPGFEWTAGTDVVTSYLWRGMNLGGLAMQPDVMVGYGGLKLEGWANISPEDYSFSAFAPELDVILSYSIAGLTVGATHQYYFDGSAFFGFSGPTAAEYASDDYNSTQTEVFAEYDFSEVFENVPLRIFWGTYIGGFDHYLTSDGSIKRAYSSYLEFSYDFALPFDLTLTPQVGMTPWRSMYTDYEGKFAVNNISLKLDWEYEISDHFGINLYAQGMLNTYGINKENIFPVISDTYGNRRLNGAIGIGLWFY